ncbi:hypothetical protein SSS_10634 [Sarcoptes scabiei]|uniref:Uncharacterized protein n=1 Tax=Sarcoptes scabiei TaxID=52283 RepID=A0A834R3J8_SARSC|nr:hypothetical protein SSS_10634 [Sarcoptes scabiei]
MILDENEEENGDRKKQSDSPKEKIDLETDEIKQIKKNVFKTEKNIETFHRLIDHIKHQPSRFRQLIETFRVYSHKRYSTYLALRLNFILDIVPSEKRSSILKDLSLVIPDRERKHFLLTCNVSL